MKYSLIGDVAALGGIVGYVLHALPEATGVVATTLGGVWYALMIYAHLKDRNKKPPHGG